MYWSRSLAIWEMLWSVYLIPTLYATDLCRVDNHPHHLIPLPWCSAQSPWSWALRMKPPEALHPNKSISYRLFSLGIVMVMWTLPITGGAEHSRCSSFAFYSHPGLSQTNTFSLSQQALTAPSQADPKARLADLLGGHFSIQSNTQSNYHGNPPLSVDLSEDILKAPMTLDI